MKRLSLIRNCLLILAVFSCALSRSWAEEEETAPQEPPSPLDPEAQAKGSEQDADLIVESAEVDEEEKSEEAKNEDEEEEKDDEYDEEDQIPESAYVTDDDKKPPLSEEELLRRFELPGHKMQTVYRPENCDRFSEIGDRVGVAMTLFFENGTEVSLKAPKHFPLPFDIGSREVLPGIELSSVGMCVGEKRIAAVPSYLAYGSYGFPELGIPPNTTLFLDMEMVSIEDGNGKRFFDALDRNDDGRLAKPKALRYLTRKQVWTKKDTAAAQYLHQKFVHEHKRVVAHFFEAFDKDENGFLHKDEYSFALPAMNAMRPPFPMFSDEEMPPEPGTEEQQAAAAAAAEASMESEAVHAHDEL